MKTADIFEFRSAVFSCVDPVLAFFFFARISQKQKATDKRGDVLLSFAQFEAKKQNNRDGLQKYFLDSKMQTVRSLYRIVLSKPAICLGD